MPPRPMDMAGDQRGGGIFVMVLHGPDQRAVFVDHIALPPQRGALIDIDRPQNLAVLPPQGHGAAASRTGLVLVW